MGSVTRTGQTSRKDRREAIQQRLVAATEGLLAEGVGFTELSVERLATAAGISRATFYVYFEDKADLVRGLLQQLSDELQAAASSWWDLAETATRDDIQATMTSILEVYRRHQAAFAAVLETTTYDADVASAYGDLMDRFVTGTRKVIERGQAAGIMRPVAAAPTAAALTWMVERTCQQTVRNAAQKTDAKTAEALTDIVWSALYPDSGRRRRST